MSDSNGKRAETTTEVKTYNYPELSTGITYANPPKPSAAIIKIPTSGISDKDRNKQLAILGRMKNAWEVEGKKAEVKKTMHDAHGKNYQAMGAAVNAGAALVQASTTWNKYQVAVVDNRISRAEKNAAISSIPYEVERISAELEKKKQALTKAELELQNAMLINSNGRQDLIESEELSRLAGYVVTPTVAGFMGNLAALLTPGGDIRYEE
jgi:hypothetical protein